MSVVVTTLAGQATFGEGTDVPQRSPDFFPLGVYWPGEFLFRTEERQIDWPKNEEVMDLLAANQCNTVWLTHTSAPDAAEFARRAAERGIYLVASLGELNGGVPHIRAGDQTARIERILQEWGDAPLPIAWGMGDEPRAEYMHEMAAYVNQWAAAGQPVTTVVMAGDVPSAGALLDLDYLCADIYAFFSENNPNGPTTIAESAAYVKEAGGNTHYWAQRQGGEYWFMGALFQEPWGPHGYDEQGNIVYAPGAGPHFRMPSPAEVRWQNWAALSTGARGLIHFSLLFAPNKDKPVPPAEPVEKWQPFGAKDVMNSGEPGGMLYPDGTPTPQFLAMGEDFARIAKVTEVLKQLTPTDEPVAFHSKGWIPPGDIVQVFAPTPEAQTLESEITLHHYAVVVNGDMENEREVPVNIQPGVVRVVDAVSGQPIPLIRTAVVTWEPIGEPFRQARVRLAPGEGTLLQLEMEN